MQTMARTRTQETKVPDAAAPARAPENAAPVAVASGALSTPAAVVNGPLSAPEEALVDPVLRLDRLMFRIWLIGAAILVVLNLLDAFYHVLMRL